MSHSKVVSFHMAELAVNWVYSRVGAWPYSRAGHCAMMEPWCIVFR
jgi:hypothetical protein